LRGPATPQLKAFPITCGVSRKRPSGESSAEIPPKKPRITRGTRSIIQMVIHEGGRQHPVKVLLDTGCSIALINQDTAKKLHIPLQKH